ncbi:DUF4199 domain-containing protein [uncultured Chitinophaga sp.]|jgi:hypothetical protein|uniref:DUF4199 domain-containing protein n=1 Tax=uncultured Chitinophaga sp. TaxID=339340 RepID=UPI0026223284|nr:DUF4199 domain-containing protein [uncultured Chitinophaga sp.]
MKKNVLVFGLIAGLIVSCMMLYSVSQCYTREDFDGSMVLGYAGMIVAFSMIFVGIKNFRDKYNNGTITFGKAFKIGLYICLVASTMYVLVWIVDYYFFVPDFMDKYTAHMLRKAQTSGATQQELQQQAAELARNKEMYKNPILMILFTYLEILPVGLVIALISAAILKRKSKGPVAAPAR